MHRRIREFSLPSRRRDRALAVLTSTLLIFTSIGVVSSEAASFKPYTISGVPGTGTQSPGTVALTLAVPSASNQELGSTQISISSGFVLTPLGTSVNGGMSSSVSSTIITFQNLNIQPGSSATVSFSVAAPCGASTATWSFSAQQANQWQSGNSANYLTLTQVEYMDGTLVGSGAGKVTETISTSYDNTGCTYDLSGLPASVNGGANNVSLTVSNVQGGTLASLTISVSTPYTITAGGSTGRSTTFPISGGTATLAFTLNAPCTDASGGPRWTFTATPTAFHLLNLNGSASWSAPITSTLAANTCHLGFIVPLSGGPAVADAQVYTGGSATSLQELSGGMPGAGAGVKVGLYDGGNNLVTVGSQSIALGLTGGTSGAVLGGTTTLATASGTGTAIFTNITVNAIGSGYQLRATSANATAALSNRFNVDQVVQACDPTRATCTVNWPTDPTTDVSSSITAYNPTGSNFFGGAVNPPFTISCAGEPFNYSDLYDETVTWYYYAGPNTLTKTVVLTIPKSYVQTTPNNGTSFYQICYAAPAEFQTSAITNIGPDGTPLAGGTYAVPEDSPNGPTAYFGEQWFYGTLPGCAANGHVAPCILAKAGTGGARIITFITPASDPIYR